MSASSAPTSFLPSGLEALPDKAAPRAASRKHERRPPAMTSRRKAESLQFHLILAATYPFFLAAALFRRVMPAKPAWQESAPPRRSVFGEAKEMAVSAIPFVFMG